MFKHLNPNQKTNQKAQFQNLKYITNKTPKVGNKTKPEFPQPASNYQANNTKTTIQTNIHKQ